MRAITVVGILALAGACTTAPAEDQRLTEARSIALQRATMLIDESIASVVQSNLFLTEDCSKEAGLDARQCNAFLAAMTKAAARFATDEKQLAVADVTDEVETLATAIAALPDQDVFALRFNLTQSNGSKSAKPLSAEVRQAIAEPDRALVHAISEFDMRLSQQASLLVMKVITELSADPTLQ